MQVQGQDNKKSDIDTGQVLQDLGKRSGVFKLLLNRLLPLMPSLAENNAGGVYFVSLHILLVVLAGITLGGHATEDHHSQSCH